MFNDARAKVNKLMATAVFLIATDVRLCVWGSYYWKKISIKPI